MLNSYPITSPVSPSTKFATPTPQDMVSAHISYVAYRPYERPVMTESGTVLQVRNYKNVMYMQVQPDSKRAPRWVSEFDFISYVRG